MGLRRRAREAAVKILYQTEMSGYPVEDCIRLYWDNLQEQDDIVEFCNYLVRGVIENLPSIDAAISRFSKNWPLGRMHRVDLCILRIAVFELLYASSIPNNVSINEAVEMAKKFGSDESSSFINGILGSVAAKTQPQERSST